MQFLLPLSLIRCGHGVSPLADEYHEGNERAPAGRRREQRVERSKGPSGVTRPCSFTVRESETLPAWQTRWNKTVQAAQARGHC